MPLQKQPQQQQRQKNHTMFHKVVTKFHTRIHYSHNNIFLLKNRHGKKKEENVQNSNYIQLLKICQHKKCKNTFSLT